MAEKKAPAKDKKTPAKKGKTGAAKTAKGSEPAAKPKTAEPEASATEAPAAEAEKAPRVKIKPQLDDETRALLEERRAKKQRTPVFRRQEWFRYKKLSRSGWRKPIGIHSKLRRHFGYRPPVVTIGYAGPAAVRGLHPSGFQEVIVHNAADLQRIDPKIQAARIGGTVGAKKREVIEQEAEKLKIRILNPMHERGEEQ